MEKSKSLLELTLTLHPSSIRDDSEGIQNTETIRTILNKHILGNAAISRVVQDFIFSFFRSTKLVEIMSPNLATIGHLF